MKPTEIFRENHPRPPVQSALDPPQSRAQWRRVRDESALPTRPGHGIPLPVRHSARETRPDSQIHPATRQQPGHICAVIQGEHDGATDDERRQRGTFAFVPRRAAGRILRVRCREARQQQRQPADRHVHLRARRVGAGEADDAAARRQHVDRQSVRRPGRHGYLSVFSTAAGVSEEIQLARVRERELGYGHVAVPVVSGDAAAEFTEQYDLYVRFFSPLGD